MQKLKKEQANAKLHIVYIPISKLKPSEYNPRKISKESLEQLKESIKRFQMVDPIIANTAPNRRNIVIGGHMRLRGAKAKTPTDNPFDERFNRTLNDEFIEMGNMSADCEIFNKRLTDWLIEYNFKRPHQALAYEVPVEYYYKNKKVSPMYPSST